MIKNLNLIFEKKQILSFIVLSIFIIISMVLESLSIGLIFPILSLMVDGDMGNKDFFFSFLYEKLNFFGQGEKIVFFLILFSTVYLLKIFFLIFFSWYKSKFVWNIHNHLSKKIYKKYLDQDLSFFKNHNTGKIIRNLTAEVSVFISSGIGPTINLISNSFILLGFIIIFLLIDFKITLILIAFTFILTFLFNFSNNFFLKKWGIKRQINEGLRISYLNQGINSIKEAKLYGKEKWFLDKFDYYNHETFNSLRNYDFIKTLPRFFLETIILVFSVSIILFFFKDQPLSEFIPFFAVLFVAFYRAIPIISQLLVSLQSITYAKPSYELITNSLNLKSSNQSKEAETLPISFQRSIEIKNLSVSYNNDDNFVFKNINLEIKKGDRIGIIGESGVGKSTFLDCLMGLVEPTNGNILVDGKDIFTNLRKWHRKIGYVPQSIYLIDDTIKNNIAFGEDFEVIKQNNIDSSLKDAELFNLINKLPEKENSIIGEKGAKISGGERQRIAIARSLYINPEIIIFDEATSGLDLDTENKIINSINKLSIDKTIIMVSHRKSSLKNCNKIYEIKKENMRLI
jgi:ATP-binding cassette, subfamily B, bacterial PglK